ncbi:MAG: Mov34/MPN/PAD-1 family protein [Pirellulaceae bacterium]
MPSDIQFGELEETRPEVHRRPDRNKHFAVAAVGPVDERDLPLFVDLDAMRDMEWHALSDTTVELGGVMLGGQYLDQDQQPFVVITDSLRAHHYQATKGSFKFTHDTWEQITREREEFPDELQMVGWYHTHPDWGVFLSGMDIFICDHFFDKPLDVALVIDPCRQDRGFFQWAENAPERVQRTSSFYLIASRFREQELDHYAAYLEGQLAMSNDPRMRGFPPSAAYPAPVVHVTEGRNVWQSVAVSSSLAIQCCLLVLIAWRLLAPPTPTTNDEVREPWATLEESITALAEARSREVATDSKIAVLDEVVRHLEGGRPGLVRSLAARTSEIDEMHASIRSHMALEKQLDSKIGQLEDHLIVAKRNGKRLDEHVQGLQTTLTALRARSELQIEQISRLEEKLAEYENPTVDGEEAESGTFWTPWTWAMLGIAAAAVCLIAGGGVATLMRHRKNPPEFEESSDELVEPTNNSHE